MSSNKFQSVCFSSSEAAAQYPHSIVYYHRMNLIDKVNDIKDLGITRSDNCNLDQHINNVFKYGFSGWILRTFISRDATTMLTLFKCVVLSRLNYGNSQLWSLIQNKFLNKIDRVQRSFNKFITGM